MHLQHRLKPRADRLLRLGAILSAIARPAPPRAGDMAPRPSWSPRGVGSAGGNGRLNALLTAVPLPRTLSAGARRDFLTDIAPQRQLDRITAPDGSRRACAGVRPGVRSGRPLRVARAVPNCVF